MLSSKCVPKSFKYLHWALHKSPYSQLAQISTLLMLKWTFNLYLDDLRRVLSKIFIDGRMPLGVKIRGQRPKISNQHFQHTHKHITSHLVTHREFEVPTTSQLLGEGIQYSFESKNCS